MQATPRSEPNLPNADEVIARKYQLVRQLGRGSMGTVWLAHHRTLHEDVALKLLTTPPGLDPNDDILCGATRFRFEAQVAARLSRRTRHIVRVTDHGEEGGVAYLVMELLEGRTLESKLMLYDHIGETEACKIVRQIARALQHAHAEGVMHRDLKPSNVFLTEDEDHELLVKVLDFGIARVVHAHLSVVPFSTASGLVFGTPGYMSPEQARGRREIDSRCDLWALATIAYEMLSGELPVEGGNPAELMASLCAARTVPIRRYRPDLSPSVEAFFERAFAQEVDARFESAAELARAFDAAFEPSVEGTAPFSPVPSPHVPSPHLPSPHVPSPHVFSPHLPSPRDVPMLRSESGTTRAERPAKRLILPPSRPLGAVLAVAFLLGFGLTVGAMRPRPAGAHPESAAIPPALPVAPFVPLKEAAPPEKEEPPKARPTREAEDRIGNGPEEGTRSVVTVGSTPSPVRSLAPPAAPRGLSNAAAPSKHDGPVDRSSIL